MGKYVASEIVKLMIRKEQKIFGAKVLQLESHSRKIALISAIPMLWMWYGA